jgi:hypothetical protein
MSRLNDGDLFRDEMIRLDKLIKEKPEGEFKKFPIFFPLSGIYLPKEGNPEKTVVQVGAVSEALKNIEKEGNRPQEFMKNVHWNQLLSRIATYLCGILDAEQLKGKDLTQVYLFVDIPENSELIKELRDFYVSKGRTPIYWAVLTPIDPAKKTTVVEQPPVKEESPDVEDDALVIGNEMVQVPEEPVVEPEAPEPVPEEPAEELVAEQEEQTEEPPKDA